MVWMVYGLASLAVLSWLVAVVSAVELVVYHPLEGHRPSWYATRGAVFFDASNFQPSGLRVHRRFLRALSAFVLMAVLTGAAVLISSA